MSKKSQVFKPSNPQNHLIRGDFDQRFFDELVKEANSMPPSPEKLKLVKALIARQRRVAANLERLASVDTIRDRVVKLAYTSTPETRTRLIPLVIKLTHLSRQAKPWGKLPNGWTQDSVKKLWDSLTGDRKHKVTACMKKMKGKVSDEGAFCASLADKMEPGWRSERSAKTIVGAAGDMSKVLGLINDLFEGRDVKDSDIDKATKLLLTMDLQDVSRYNYRDLKSWVPDLKKSARGGKRSVGKLLKAVEDTLKDFERFSYRQRSAKKMKDKESDSDIEPTHSRKEWPELPPGVKAASVCAGYLEGDKIVLTKKVSGPGGMLLPGMSGTVTGVGSGAAHDHVTIALDSSVESHSLTSHIPVSPKALKKQACGCGCGCVGDCGCQGQCTTAKHHVESFVQSNPDLGDILSGVHLA